MVEGSLQHRSSTHRERSNSHYRNPMVTLPEEPTRTSKILDRFMALTYSTIALGMLGVVFLISLIFPRRTFEAIPGFAYLYNLLARGDKQPALKQCSASAACLQLEATVDQAQHRTAVNGRSLCLHQSSRRSQT